MSIAVYIKSDSGDDYLYCFENEENARDQAEALCDEEPDCWLTYMEESSW